MRKLTLSSFSEGRKPVVSQCITNLHSAIDRRSHYRAVTCRTYGKASLLLLVGEVMLRDAIARSIQQLDFGVVVWTRVMQAWSSRGGPTCKLTVDHLFDHSFISFQHIQSSANEVAMLSHSQQLGDLIHHITDFWEIKEPNFDCPVGRTNEYAYIIP